MSEAHSGIYEIQVDKLVYGGEALGRLPDGRAVFVPFALPGETVRIELVEEKKRFARAHLLEVLSPAANRIAPRCQHYAACGGCHYQHLDYNDQLAAKTAILADQLERIGGLNEPPLAEIVAATEPWAYRNHIQFHQTEDGRLGFRAWGSDLVVPIEECFLPQPALAALWPQLDLEPLPDVARVGLRAGAEEDLMLVLESYSDQALEFNVDFPISAVQLGPEEAHILSGDFYLTMEISGRQFRVSAEAFFQVNIEMAEKMVAHLLANLPLTPESTVLDVYCGVGLFSAFIAPRVARLIGIEAHPGAAEDFVDNLDEFENVELYEDAAEAVMPHLDVQPDVVVVDPPRAGLDTAVLDALAALKPAVIAYVSCDPATLARDAKRLTNAGYKLAQITPFDMFPQTFHIESISIWKFNAL